MVRSKLIEVLEFSLVMPLAHTRVVAFSPICFVDTFKFLGFEQVFKKKFNNSSNGAAKGGSDFDPKGKSDKGAFLPGIYDELIRHIGKDTDVPAGTLVLELEKLVIYLVNISV